MVVKPILIAPAFVVPGTLSAAVTKSMVAPAVSAAPRATVAGSVENVLSSMARFGSIECTPVMNRAETANENRICFIRKVERVQGSANSST